MIFGLLILFSTDWTCLTGVTTGIFGTAQKRDPSIYTVRAGSDYSHRGGEEYKVSDIYTRDIYNGATTHNDISLLKLTRSMTLDGRTKKATKLPTSSSYNVPTDTNCYVQGWG